MKKHLCMAINLLVSCVIYGQISTQEEPVSFRTDIPALRMSERTMKSFASLDRKTIEQEDIEDEANGIPPPARRSVSLRRVRNKSISLSTKNLPETISLPVLFPSSIYKTSFCCEAATSHSPAM